MQASGEETSIEMKGVVDRITYRNEENGYSVVRVKESRNDLGFTVVGHFPNIRKGEHFQFFGEWVQHKSFGNQFKVDRAVPLRPSNKESIIKYLSSDLLKGVGPKTAAKIVKVFGEETLDILDNEPERLAEVRGLNKKLRDMIVNSWEENKRVHEVMLFLTEHGLSSLFANRIFKLYGRDSIDIVSRNPYRLAADITGIGFLSADRVAQSLGVAQDSEERVSAGLLHCLLKAEADGHCYVTTEQLLDQLKDLLELPAKTIYPKFVSALSRYEQSQEVFSEMESEENSLHFQKELYIAENNIAAKVKELLDEPLTLDTERVDAWLDRYMELAGTSLSAQQRSAVTKAAASRLFVLTGGPGVGKTTTANTIIRLFKAMGKSVALCAPTGRAAQRLSEVSGQEAKTIHRLLEWVPSEGGFLKNESNALTAQVVICDEASMLDVRLADALFRSVPTSSQLILIGDVDQLPAVGPGNILRDLIQSERVPFTLLDQIFRQSQESAIVKVAHEINKGQKPDFLPEFRDCFFRGADTAIHIKEIIKDFLKYEAPKLGYDPVRDIQILTPMNRGELGTQQLNSEIQEILNPKRPGLSEFKRGSFVIRPHDKVIQVANNYDLGVFNGDIGTVLVANVDDGKIIVSFGDRQVSYTDESILDLRLAYAITIHKSQGSEFPVSIIPLSMQHFVMLQRNLYYTALTRAKRLALFVGEQKALSKAVKTQTSLQRQTALISRIHDCMSQGEVEQ